MLRFKLLPHWCITTLKSAFYDMESLTAVEQTGRLYKTIQDLIEDYNKYVDEINSTINEFITSADKDQTAFEDKINKIVHDYIAMMDTKIAHQDREIEEAIQYMKDNLSESVASLVTEMKEQGELSEAILGSLNELEPRMTNAETKITTLETATNELTSSISAIEVPTKTSELTNDSNFVDKEYVDSHVPEVDLTDYYTKEETNAMTEEMVTAIGYMLEMVPEIAMLEVTMTGEAMQPASVHVNYPEGFTKENTNLISIMQRWDSAYEDDETGELVEYTDWGHVSPNAITFTCEDEQIFIQYLEFCASDVGKAGTSNTAVLKMCIMMNPTIR